MQNLVKSLHKKEKDSIFVDVRAVITNSKNAKGIDRANELGVRCEVLEHDKFDTREAFDEALSSLVLSYAPRLCVLAGFMRILTPAFTSKIKSINIHPSLLPLFKGAHAIKESYESDIKIAGVTTHWVSSELDGGKIIDQECIKKRESEDFLSFERRIHDLEYKLYPNSVIKALKELDKGECI